MPLLICLKEPPINLIVEGDIKNESEKQWDEIFHNQILMVKRQDGLNMIIPLLRECNIAFMQEVTDKEIEEQKEEAEKRMKQREAQGGGRAITRPEFIFPQGGKKGRGN